MRGPWADVILRGSLPDSMVFLTEYDFDTGARRERLRTDLESRGGGALGIHTVDEVVIGVKEFAGAAARWQRLLDPAPPESPGVWRLGGGPAVRLVPDTSDRLRALVFQTSSLREAAEFLAGGRMLGEDIGQEVAIDPAAVAGLDLRLR
jgi:hypothetical protein